MNGRSRRASDIMSSAEPIRSVADSEGLVNGWESSGTVDRHPDIERVSPAHDATPGARRMRLRGVCPCSARVDESDACSYDPLVVSRRPKHSMSSTDITARAFMNKGVARRMAAELLSPPEARILIDQKEAFAGKRVLDVGVGSGRVTQYLHPFASEYVGTDISPAMLACARAAYPDVRFIESDMRSLSELDEPPFDFILIAYNTIDVLSQDERLKLLRVVSRMLPERGVLVFSSHNRAWTRAGKAPQFPGFGSVGFPRWAYQVAVTARERLNHARLAKHQRTEKEYALYTGSHCRTGIVYYIDRPALERQLTECGLTPVDIYDNEGHRLGDRDLAVDSYNLHVVCRRSEGGPPMLE